MFVPGILFLGMWALLIWLWKRPHLFSPNPYADDPRPFDYEHDGHD